MEKGTPNSNGSIGGRFAQMSRDELLVTVQKQLKLLKALKTKADTLSEANKQLQHGRTSETETEGEGDKKQKTCDIVSSSQPPSPTKMSSDGGTEDVIKFKKIAMKYKQLFQEKESENKELAMQLDAEKKKSALELEKLKEEKEDEINTITAEMKNSSKELEQTLNSNHKICEKLEEENGLLRTQLEEMEGKREQEQKPVDNATPLQCDECKLLRENVSFLKNEMEEAKNREETISQNATKARENIQKQHDTATQLLKEELEERDNEIRVLKDTIATHETVVEHLKLQHEKEFNELLEKCANTNSTAEERMDDNTTADFVGVEAKVAELEKENIFLEKQIEDLRTSNVESQQSLKALTVSNKKIVKHNTQQTATINKLQGEVESKAEAVAELQTLLSQSKETVEQLESAIQVKQSAAADLTTSLKVSQRALEEEQLARASVEERLAETRSLLEETKSKLNAATEDASQSSILDLELADSQRTIITLQTSVSTLEKKVEQLESKNIEDQENIASMKKKSNEDALLLKKTEQQCTKLKQLLVKLRHDLDTKKESLQSANRTIEELKAEMSALSSQADENVSEHEEARAQIKLLQEHHRDIELAHEIEIRKLTSQVEYQTQLSDKLQLDLQQTKSDFQKYRARALTSLREDKRVVELQEAKNKILLLEQERDDLLQRSKVQHKQVSDTQESFSTLEQNFNALESQHASTLKELADLTTRYKSEVSTSMASKREVEQRHVSSLAALRKQHTTAMEDRLQRQREQFEHEIEDANDKIAVLEKKLHETMEEMNITQKTSLGNESFSATPSVPTFPTAQRPLGTSSSQSTTPPALSRSGSVPTEVLIPNRDSVHINSRNSDITLEQLLSKQHHDGVENEEDLSQFENTKQLREEIVMLRRKLKHVTELLSTSEASVARLTGEINVLKTSMRVDERNAQREDISPEYLKNVVVSFIDTRNKSLVPVLTKLLVLTREEQNILLKAASTSSKIDRWLPSF
eukprot:m.139301 g.139301  ORF g.139301 m.139301 type:complete len:990 (+) comp13167_c0_seq2:135-3104(+)